MTLPNLLHLSVTFLTVEFIFRTLTDTLNLGASRQAPPKGLEDLYDEATYRNSQEYLRANTLSTLWERSIGFFLTVSFLMFGGLAWVESLARAVTPSPAIQPIIFFGVLFLLGRAMSLPFSIYDTFVTEERFGFNRTTPKTFVADVIKGLLLTALLGTPVLVGILAFFRLVGADGWWMAWAGFTGFQFFLLFVAPVVIMPLFNRYTPLPEGELKKSIEDFAVKQSFQMKGIFTMDGSKRSSKANAFFTGFGPFRRIVLFDTLIEKQTTEELVAILAHEIGHYQLGHIFKQLALSTLTTGLLFWGLGFMLFEPQVYEDFGVTAPYVGFLAAMLLYSPISMVMGFVSMGLSRKFEFEADAYARETTGRPQALASGLKKLSKDSLSNLTPHPLKVWASYSHPPLSQRLAALLGQ